MEQSVDDRRNSFRMSQPGDGEQAKLKVGNKSVPCEIIDQSATTERFDSDGNRSEGYHSRFELSRSGGAKVMTTYHGADSFGAAFIYRIDQDQFVTVHTPLAPET